MENTTQLIWSILFGGIGLEFFTYGKKQKAVVPFVIGVALFVFPYFITNAYLLVIGGIVLVAIPF